MEKREKKKNFSKKIQQNNILHLKSRFLNVEYQEKDFKKNTEYQFSGEVAWQF